MAQGTSRTSCAGSPGAALASCARSTRRSARFRTNVGGSQTGSSGEVVDASPDGSVSSMQVLVGRTSVAQWVEYGRLVYFPNLPGVLGSSPYTHAIYFLNTLPCSRLISSCWRTRAHEATELKRLALGFLVPSHAVAGCCKMGLID